MTAAETYKDLKAGSVDFAPYKDRILFRRDRHHIL